MVISIDKKTIIKVIFKPLLLLANMVKSSKPDEWLQDKRCFFMAELLSSLTLFPVRAETPRYFQILTLKWCLVLPQYVALQSPRLNL